MKKSSILVVVLLVLAGTGFAWFYVYGPCGTKSVQDAFKALDEKNTNYQDALEIARNTPLDSLAPMIAGLQERKRSAQRLQVPSCTEAARGNLLRSMEASNSAVLAIFDEESSTVVDEKFGIASGYLDDYSIEADRVLSCAPFCN